MYNRRSRRSPFPFLKCRQVKGTVKRNVDVWVNPRRLFERKSIPSHPGLTDIAVKTQYESNNSTDRVTMHQFLLITYFIRSYKLFIAGLTHWVLNVPNGDHGTFVTNSATMHHSSRGKRNIA